MLQLYTKLLPFLHQFYLQQEESMTLEKFLATGWAMMRPVYRMDRRMFTPPSTTTEVPPGDEEITPPPPVFDEEVTIRGGCVLVLWRSMGVGLVFILKVWLCYEQQIKPVKYEYCMRLFCDAWYLC